MHTSIIHVLSSQYMTTCRGNFCRGEAARRANRRAGRVRRPAHAHAMRSCRPRSLVSLVSLLYGSLAFAFQFHRSRIFCRACLKGYKQCTSSTQRQNRTLGRPIITTTIIVFVAKGLAQFLGVLSGFRPLYVAINGVSHHANYCASTRIISCHHGGRGKIHGDRETTRRRPPRHSSTRTSPSDMLFLMLFLGLAALHVSAEPVPTTRSGCDVASPGCPIQTDCPPPPNKTAGCSASPNPLVVTGNGLCCPEH